MKKTIIQWSQTIWNSLRKRRFLLSKPNPHDLSKKDVKRAIRLGFTPNEYAVFHLKDKNPAEYISDWERQLFREKARNYKILMDNKIIFYHLVKDYAEVNRIYAYKEGTCFMALEPDFSESNLMEQLKKFERIVYKKNNSGGGEGVMLLEYRDDKLWINRVESSLSEVNVLIEDTDYILEEFCEQGEFENNLWPYSVNTLRIVTLKQKNGSYSIGLATQRIGVEKEAFVDNAHVGGVYTDVDIDTGRMHQAISRTKSFAKDAAGEFICYDQHPVTKAQIEGAVIPRWNEIKGEILTLHQSLSFTNIPFIAWDIALKDDHFTVIEANTSCGVYVLQTFKGMRNGVVGQWMKDYGYIK